MNTVSCLFRSGLRNKFDKPLLFNSSGTPALRHSGNLAVRQKKLLYECESIQWRSCFPKSCFPKNELASRGEPLAIFGQSKKKPHALKRAISKTCLFLGGRMFLLINTMLRKIYGCCFPKNELASGYFWVVSLKAPSLQEKADYLKNLFIFRRENVFIN